MDEIVNRLENAKNILVASHCDPDGDAVGSLLAMGLALDKLGKDIVIYNGSPIPAVYRFLPSVDRIVNQIDENTGFDTALILDCGQITRIGDAHALVSRIPVTINIDHHITNTRFGTLQLIDPSACSTAEIVHNLIIALNVPIDKAIAASIYTGILTDTGSFRFSNTNQAAFAISREMVQYGVEPYYVSQHVFGKYSLGRIKLLNLALDSIEISDNGKLSIMTLTKEMFAETGTQPEDVDGMINYARRIEDVKVAALIQEQCNGVNGNDALSKFHVSLRSDGTVDVAEIAGTFGGGGHSNAAGFQVEMTMAKLKSQIITLSNNL